MENLWTQHRIDLEDDIMVAPEKGGSVIGAKGELFLKMRKKLWSLSFGDLDRKVLDRWYSTLKAAGCREYRGRMGQ